MVGGGSLAVDNYSVRLDELPGIFIYLYVYLHPRDPYHSITSVLNLEELDHLQLWLQNQATTQLFRLN